MSLGKLSLRGSFAIAAILGLGLVLVGVAPHKPTQPARVVTDPAGNTLLVPAQAGVTKALWNGQPVLVFLAPKVRLDGVDLARGMGHATPALEVPGHPDLRLFVFSGRSTQSGCTLAFNPSLAASLEIADYDGDSSPDGRVIDPCHQGTWDIYEQGVPVSGAAFVRLATLDASIVGDHLEATAFDGPVGAQR